MRVDLDKAAVVSYSRGKSPRARFDAAYRVDASGCWLWTRSTDKGKGRLPYGRLWLNGRHEFAHRVSWLLFKGEIPDGMKVLHRCDVANCVNPAHLFLGTSLDNTRDMIRKGRKVVVVGEAHPHAKLSTAAVAEIIKATEPQRVIAQRFGVCQKTISKIKRGETWRENRI